MKNSKASECSNHVFLFCFWWFDIWGLTDTRGTISPSITQPFLSSNNIWLTCKHNFHTQTHQPRVHTATTSFILYSHNLGDYSPALVTLWLGTRQLVTAPMPQSLLKSFKLANPKPVYPALLSLPLETTKSCLPNIFPLLSRPPDELWCFPGCPHSHPQCGIIHHTWVITKPISLKWIMSKLEKCVIRDMGERDVSDILGGGCDGSGWALLSITS